MSEESAITPELKAMLGVEQEPTIIEVEKGHIRAFAEAIGDSNPQWQDPEFGSKSIYGSIIAPPTFLQNAGLKKICPKLWAAKCPLPNHLYAGMEIELFSPIQPCDVITAHSKLVDLYEKMGKSGKLLFMVIETSLTNQRGEPVSKGRHVFMKL